LMGICLLGRGGNRGTRKRNRTCYPTTILYIDPE
jgi:hypothetical protein